MHPMKRIFQRHHEAWQGIETYPLHGVPPEATLVMVTHDLAWRNILWVWSSNDLLKGPTLHVVTVDTTKTDPHNWLRQWTLPQTSPDHLHAGINFRGFWILLSPPGHSWTTTATWPDRLDGPEIHQATFDHPITYAITYAWDRGDGHWYPHQTTDKVAAWPQCVFFVSPPTSGNPICPPPQILSPVAYRKGYINTYVQVVPQHQQQIHEPRSRFGQPTSQEPTSQEIESCLGDKWHAETKDYLGWRIVRTLARS